MQNGYWSAYAKMHLKGAYLAIIQTYMIWFLKGICQQNFNLNEFLDFLKNSQDNVLNVYYVIFLISLTQIISFIPQANSK